MYFLKTLKDLKPLQSIVKAFIHLAYPPLCLHCGEGLSNPDPLFCENCAAMLEMIRAEDRCHFCFALVENVQPPICAKCKQTPSLFTRMGSAFDYMGPASTLVSKLKYSNMPYLAKGMGAYMAAQIVLLNWPLPDVIIPAPIMKTHLFVRGYNQSELLAHSLAAILGCPVQKALSRRSGDYSQAGLSKSQRLQLGNSIQLKPHQNLHDKCILLIDDVLTTGSTMKKCAQALMEDYPRNIYGLTFSRAM